MQQFRRNGSGNVATNLCSPKKRINAAAATGSLAAPAVQLTPLWEHILRTRTLPEHICPAQIYAEFYERLGDPEWQVRQHALRVLVDVLVVMREAADAYMEPLIPQLVDNLGHSAPTVRKGALDCLRVYLVETAMPETVLLQILDIGLNQNITNEPFGGRLMCGVLLSLPALVQCTLHTEKRDFILRNTIDMLIEKMGQVPHQEITLKVLSKIRELIGEEELVHYMGHGTFTEFELLCNVYGLEKTIPKQPSAQKIGTATSSWRVLHTDRPGQICWRSASVDEGAAQGKVIMETEIKINDDTLTMRLLEAKDEDDSLENDIVCGQLTSASKKGRFVQSFSDSELEDVNRKQTFSTILTPSTPSRTPKRVTFGGEVVKIRTPDSDAAVSIMYNKNRKEFGVISENSANSRGVKELGSEHVGLASFVQVLTSSPSASLPNSPRSKSKTSELSVEIPNDNTKPLSPHPKSLQSSSPEMKANPVNTSVPPFISSLSPKSSYKRLSISSVESNISPKTPHKEIEVLHNLQRDPSPSRAKSTANRNMETLSSVHDFGEPETHKEIRQHGEIQTTPQMLRAKSWEELDIVDYETLMDLRSGVSKKENYSLTLNAF